jgi:chloramphenicol-sensitive protein RarD
LIDKDKLAGTLYAVSAFSLWGILPIYWKFLKRVDSIEILAYRILWAFVFFILLIFIQHRFKELKQSIADKKSRVLLIIAAALIGFNWFIYVWAVNHEKIVEASLGYYINPLLSVILGVVFLKEKLKTEQIIALFIAITGVLIMIFRYGKIPYIALTLAIMFGSYGLVKKIIKIKSLVSLTMETLLLVPVSLSIILSREIHGKGVVSNNNFSFLFLLIFGGVLTALPLFFFVKSTKKIKLSSIGFIQYLSPSLNLLIGIFIYKEIFTKIHFLSFSFIWLALIIFSVSNIKEIMVKSQ